MIKPDFFIVGAPKCGTTAMYEYLRQHPEIFLPANVKEPNYFSADIHPLSWQRLSLDQYLALFTPSANQKRIGEASVWYLYSKQAAQEIKQFNPEARIIIMLRNPVDMLYSLHSELLYCFDEDIEDFEKALAAEDDRKKALHKPCGGLAPQSQFYRDIGKYSEQVRRYYDLFGRDRVHVMIFDEFEKDTGGTYKKVLHFLSVKDDFQPIFKVANSNKRYRFSYIRQLLMHDKTPPIVSLFGKAFLPKSIRLWMRKIFIPIIIKLTTQQTRRKPMDIEIKKKLQAEFAPDIDKLGKLLGRDLTFWTKS